MPRWSVAAGNRKTETITESGTTINKTYYYNDKNLLTKIEILGAETIEYDYDENGNQIKVSVEIWEYGMVKVQTVKFTDILVIMLAQSILVE